LLRATVAYILRLAAGWAILGLWGCACSSPIECSRVRSDGGRAIRLRDQASSRPSVARTGEWRGRDDGYGSSLTVLPDVDGDGIPEIGIGAPRVRFWEQRIAAYRGGAVAIVSGRSGAALTSWLGPAGGKSFGWAVADGGDSDRDGEREILVSSPWLSGPQLWSLSPRSGEVVHAEAWEDPSAALGTTIEPLGDVDGDGVGDLAFGAPSTLPGRGELRVISGVGFEILEFLAAGEDETGLGGALCVAGDADGDASPEIAIAGGVLGPRGVRFYSTREGRVLFESTFSEDAAIRGILALAFAGDLDGDGVADVVMTVSRGATLDAIEIGALAVSGRNGGVLPWRPSLGLELSVESRIAGGVDLDRDGVPDVLLTNPVTGAESEPQRGEVVAVSGRTGERLWSAPSRGLCRRLGTCCIWGGDVDGDGVRDAVVGAERVDGAGTVFALSGRTGAVLFEFQ
jgi:hypothetical protein